MPNLNKWEEKLANYLGWEVKSEQINEIRKLLDKDREKEAAKWSKHIEMIKEELPKEIRQSERHRILEIIDVEKVDMKETHACRFNDGKNDCECYLKALKSLKDKILLN